MDGLTAGKHTEHKMIDIAKTKELRVFLDQINTTNNFLDGEPSTLLGTVSVSNKPFGKVISCRFEFPIFKKLINGCITEVSVRITDQNNIVLDNNNLPIINRSVNTMSIFGADYESDLPEIMEDLDMNENRIKDLRNPRDANDAVNKRYMNKRIEYKTKDLENKLTAIQTQITNIQQQLDGIKPFTSDLDMGNNRKINVGHPRNQNIISSMRMMQSQPNLFMTMLKPLTKIS